MHTHQQAGLRIATCGLLVLAFAASAEDGIATGAAQAPGHEHVLEGAAQ